MHPQTNKLNKNYLYTVLALHTRLLIHYQIQTRYKPENSLKIQNISVTLLKATNSTLKGKLMFLPLPLFQTVAFMFVEIYVFLA